MVSFKDYVAGWLDSSIADFLRDFPRGSKSAKYVLITSLDSNVEPASLLDAETPPSWAGEDVERFGDGILMPIGHLLDDCRFSQIFFGFDEAWFFQRRPEQPKPGGLWLVGPGRVKQRTLNELGPWMAENDCVLALGDGEGLNFVLKARGLVKHALGHSIEQARPTFTFTPTSDEGTPAPEDDRILA